VQVGRHHELDDVAASKVDRLAALHRKRLEVFQHEALEEADGHLEERQGESHQGAAHQVAQGE